jgi:hypothetical protein
MLSNYLFVSCDIVAHSAEADVDVQRNRVVSINQIIAAILKKVRENEIIWMSRGDGGHLAFPVDGQIQLAIELITKLRIWSKESNVPLRITGCCGPGEIIEGADGRIQLVGPGINLAGILLPLGSPFNVLVTTLFREKIEKLPEREVEMYDKRKIELKNFGSQEIYLLSVKNVFDSEWEDKRVISDHFLVVKALEENNFLEVIYRAKRLFGINTKDKIATDALEDLAKGRIRPQSKDVFLYDLFLDLQAGPQMLQAATLIERRRGEWLCEYNDEGETMFLILKGKIGVFLPNDKLELPRDLDPGALTGELAFALGRKRTASLECLEDTALLAFNYDDLLKNIDQSEAKGKLDQFLNENILRNWWDNAPYLANIERYESSDPWFHLRPFSKVSSFPRQNRMLKVNDYLLSNKSMVILVRGELESVENPSFYIKGEDYPIVYANFPEEFEKTACDYRVKTAILKLLSIDIEGFYKLNSALFDKVLLNIKKELGVFDRTTEVTKVPSPNQRNKKKYVFISYSHENVEDVERLSNDLALNGHEVWSDLNINPGQDWKFEIRRAMKLSYAFLLCLSTESQARNKSGVYPEALDAINAYREYPPGSVFLIPIRFSDCEIPPIEIDGSRELGRLQYVDLFPESVRAKGIKKLLKSIELAPEWYPNV